MVQSHRLCFHLFCLIRPHLRHVWACTNSHLHSSFLTPVRRGRELHLYHSYSTQLQVFKGPLKCCFLNNDHASLTKCDCRLLMCLGVDPALQSCLRWWFVLFFYSIALCCVLVILSTSCTQLTKIFIHMNVGRNSQWWLKEITLKCTHFILERICDVFRYNVWKVKSLSGN